MNLPVCMSSRSTGHESMKISFSILHMGQGTAVLYTSVSDTVDGLLPAEL